MATDTRDQAQAAEVTALAWDGVVLRGISWKTYLRLRDNPRNDGVRMSYLDGTLALMSPEYLHDHDSRRLAMVVDMVAEALRIPCQGTATTTLRRKGARPRKGSGKEPDYGFYFGDNDDRMRNKTEIDLELELDPPPDLAIEVDHKSDSSTALAIYAKLGVPEVWRYKPRTKALWFGRLVDGHYEAIDRSVNLPRLTPDLVLQALGRSGDLREIDWRPWLRAWALELPEVPPTA
jgi:Uma2 family endonuclease